MLEIMETKLKDLDNIKKLWSDGEVMYNVGFENGLIYTDEEILEWYQYIDSNRPNTNHFSIYENGKYCGETYYSIDLNNGNIASLDIKLHKFARGRNIAFESLSFAIDKAFENGAIAVYVDPVPGNTKAIKLYKRLGFVEMMKPDFLVDEDVDSIYMEIRKNKK